MAVEQVLKMDKTLLLVLKERLIQVAVLVELLREIFLAVVQV